MAKLSSAGLEAVYFGFADSTGLPIGLSPTLANGSDEIMGQMLAAQEFDFQEPESPTTTVLGDDKAYFTYQFQPTELASGSLSLGIFDATLAAQAIGSTTIDNAFPFGADVFNLKDMWLVVNSQAKSASSANYGSAGYAVDIYKVNMRPRYRQGYSNQTEATYAYDMVSVPFSRLPWGQALSSISGANINTLGGLTGRFLAGKEIYQTYIGDGTSASFDLKVSPIEISADAVKVSEYVPGTTTYTELTYVSGTPSAGEYQVTETGGVYTVTTSASVTDGTYLIARILRA